MSSYNLVTTDVLTGKIIVELELLWHFLTLHYTTLISL
jgi:hypothetical protein